MSGSDCWFGKIAAFRARALSVMPLTWKKSCVVSRHVTSNFYARFLPSVMRAFDQCKGSIAKTFIRSET
jgi:hypothetical protein